MTTARGTMMEAIQQQAYCRMAARHSLMRQPVVWGWGWEQQVVQLAGGEGWVQQEVVALVVMGTRLVRRRAARCWRVTTLGFERDHCCTQSDSGCGGGHQWWWVAVEFNSLAGCLDARADLAKDKRTATTSHRCVLYQNHHPVGAHTSPKGNASTLHLQTMHHTNNNSTPSHTLNRQTDSPIASCSWPFSASTAHQISTRDGSCWPDTP